MSSSSVCSSSVLAGSSSQQPGAVFGVKPEDRDKIVATNDLAEGQAREVSSKIAAINKLVTAAIASLQEVEDKIRWRQVRGQDLKHLSPEIKRIDGELDKCALSLHDPVAGVDTELSALDDKSKIPDLLEQIQATERRCALAQKTTKRLLAYTDSAKVCQEYGTFMDSRGLISSFCLKLQGIGLTDTSQCLREIDSIITGCFELVAPQLAGDFTEAKPLAQKIGAVKLVEPELKSERLKVRVRKDLYKHLLEICLQVVKKTYVLDITKFSYREEVLEALLKRLRPVVNPEDVQVTDSDVTALKGKGDANFYVWRYASRWSYVPGYKGDRTLGDSFEQDVGQPLAGLISKLASRPENLPFYSACLNRLEQRYMQKLKSLSERGPDILTDTVFNYALGLEYAFREARSLIKYHTKMASQPAASVYKALEKLQVEYRALNQNGDLGRITSLYESLVAMQEVEKARPKLAKGERFKKRFDRALWHLADLLRNIHGKKDPELLALVGEEKEVVARVLGPATIELPKSTIISFIAKRIVAYLALSSPRHDIELDIVLHVMRAHVEKDLGDLLNKYEAKRKALNLKTPIKVITNALIAASEKTASSAYAKAWQRYFEYLRKNAEEHEVCKVVDGFVKGINGYPVMYPPVMNTSIELWPVHDPAEFLKKLHRDADCVDAIESQKKPLLFNSLVFRLAASARHARSPTEQVLALEKLYILITKKEYTQLVASFDDHTKEMIVESSLEKIIPTSTNSTLLIAEVELTLLKPRFEAYKAAKVQSRNTVRIEKALMKLMKLGYIEKDEAWLASKQGGIGAWNQ